MLRLLPVIALGALALPLPAQTPLDAREQAQIARKLEGLVPGPPVACIAQSHTRGSIHAGDAVLFDSRDGTRYLTRFKDGCTARSFEALVTRTPIDRLCRGDIVEITDLQAGFTSRACTYGDFVPYRKPR